MSDGSACFDLTVTNNIAAGCRFAAFIAPGHDCGISGGSNRFKNNVAHSTEGAGGAVYPDKLVGKNHNQCYEISYFAAYKTTLPGLAAFYPVDEIRAHHITIIDTLKGVSLQTGKDGEDLKIRFADSHIYGETEALDCP